MACGMIAMQSAGIEVDTYTAYEIDKYAIKVASHNFPLVEQKGDVFTADFTQYEGVDFVVGGSPCTYWSIAQKNNRETEASGMGWELFSQYVRAIHEAKPNFFIYENNKSMSKEIRASIDKAFGFEAVHINSALVSAQNRQRLYWVGKREPDGSYSKVRIEQPEDRGILLRDVLDSAYPYRQTETEKGYCLDANYWKTPGSPETFLEGGHARANRTMVAEPVAPTTINVNPSGKGMNGCAITCDRKSRCLTTNKGEGQKIIEPVRIANLGESGGQGQRVYSTDGKASAVRANGRQEMISEPVRVGTMPQLSGVLKDNQATRICSTDGKAVTQSAQGGGWGAKTGLYACPVDYKIRNNTDICITNRNVRQVMRDKKHSSVQESFVYFADSQTNALTTAHVPMTIEKSDGKTQPIYEVRNGLITIKGKQYPIKLVDGFYIIRKLTVSECKRLQTVPEWYDFSVISNSQAYKCLGNGWTVDVIAHLLRGIAEQGKVGE